VHIHLFVDTPIDLHDCTRCHCLAARRRARELTRRYERKLRPHGLRATQFSILAALGLRGPTPVGELAALLGLERTTLTRGAAVLERNGWIASGRSSDARTHPLRLTRSGRAKLASALPAWKEVQDQIDAGTVRRGRGNAAAAAERD
jgi:DNA-binding MarR family transcriptional regulator